MGAQHTVWKYGFKTSRDRSSSPRPRTFRTKVIGVSRLTQRLRFFSGFDWASIHRRWTAFTGSTALSTLMKKTIESKHQEGINGGVEHTARYAQFHDLKMGARFSGLYAFQLLFNLGLYIVVFKTGIFNIELILRASFRILSRLLTGVESYKYFRMVICQLERVDLISQLYTYSPCLYHK